MTVKDTLEKALGDKRPGDLHADMRTFIDGLGIAAFLHLVAEVMYEKANDVSPDYTSGVEVTEDTFAPEIEEADVIRYAADEIEAIAWNLV